MRYVIALLLGLLWSSSVEAEQGRCTNVTELTAVADSSITSRPGRVCSAQLFATAANASCVVCNTPDTNGDCEHAQGTMLSEPGVATSGESESHYLGEGGVWAPLGIGGRVSNGRCVVNWGSQ